MSVCIYMCHKTKEETMGKCRDLNRGGDKGRKESNGMFMTCLQKGTMEGTKKGDEQEEKSKATDSR